MWHSFTTIVFLTQNMHAKGILGDIQSEMRQRKLSDASWTLLQQRVLRPPKETAAARSNVLNNLDPRLQQPLFSTHPVQTIVLRHSLRASIAYKNAVKACTQRRQRLYKKWRCGFIQCAHTPESLRNCEPSLHWAPSHRLAQLCLNAGSTLWQGVCPVRIDEGLPVRGGAHHICRR